METNKSTGIKTAKNCIKALGFSLIASVQFFTARSSFSVVPAREDKV